ncbi:MAG: OmpA family protein [Aquificae bacterium]|nr:OmpA family protein [Aquificota bacterium]
MKKLLILGVVSTAFLAGCSQKALEDPCKDKNAALSKYLLDKCYGHYFEQIEVNKENIEKLNARVAKVETDLDELRKEVEEIRAEVDKLKITGKEQVRVYFDTGKFTLRSDAKETLNELVEAVRDKDIKKVIVVGYADPRGSSGFNFELSMKRAQNVAAYLIKNGMPVEKVRIAAYGEELAELIGESYPEQRAVDVIVLY